ncbi:lamin tail domain-containing protein 2 isoform X2 [Hyla sarda]|uniref:lamin tail domain-containing protein 2 isoform X2 n=1 Tax=Hyla sarda TaxID=327740 RepID=UPI0024C3F336|nr:lamin tail domain-containing protein 2 isoform X2 [Hyla sarda]XP_056383086.1 lamin tail domain-containing protein 2 isoform X2 [Hyla sarda]
MNTIEKNGSAPFQIALKKQVTCNKRRGRESQPRTVAQPAVHEMYSSFGFLKIAEVNSLGHFIRIMNTSAEQDIDISGYLLQQLEGGQVVSMYRFPHSLLLPSLQHITIWASGAKVSQNPPTDLVWKGQVYFRSNPQCITVLSRPNGQPVAFLKNKELSSWSETASSNLCKVQRVIRRPVMEQNNVNSTPSPITTLPRTCAAPEERMSQNMLPYSTYIRPKFYSAFRNLGLAHSEPRPVSVTWQPQRVNTSSPLIRLLVQKTARSKHGFIFLSHIPFTCDILKV